MHHLRSFLGPASAVLALGCLTYACGGDDDTATTTSTTNNSGGGGAGAAGGSGAAGGAGGGAGGMPPASGANCEPAMGQAGTVTFTPVHQNLSFPMMVTFAPGDDERLFILERGGTILVSKNGEAPIEFVDIDDGSNDFSDAGEGGLLGLAFHPDYATNGRFFVHFTAGNPFRNVIQEYRRDPQNPDVADPVPVHAPHLEVAQQEFNHNGGHIQFGPHDGYLYLAIGDGGPQGDPEFDSQTFDNLLGKILRIDVSTTDGMYAVPSGNHTAGMPEIFDWGLRNPYRFSFDLCTGERYIADVGHGNWEEVDIAGATQGPTNWGWNCFEGTSEYSGANQACPVGGETPPAHEYPHSAGNLSITGGVVYRGHAIPWLRGTYFYADWYSGRVWMFRYENNTVVDNQEVGQLGGQGVTGFGHDNRGEVYVTHASGTVYQVTAE